MALTKEQIEALPLTELLAIAMEEAAELIMALSKARRFGLDSFSPYDPLKTPNHQAITSEFVQLRDLIHVIMGRSH